MVFGSVLPVYGSLKTYIMMITNMKDYVTLDLDDYDADLRYNYRDTMIAQFKQDFYKKNLSLQDQGKCDQINTLQNRIKLWLNLIDKGFPIPDTSYDNAYNDDGLDDPVCGAEIFPEIKQHYYSDINDSENNERFYR